MFKRKLTYKDFKQYFSNNLPKKDKHAFEKNIMQDAFEEEAFDGLSKLSENELEQDIIDLKSTINQKTNKPRRIIPVWYRYAASVIILVGVGLSIFFLNSRFWQNSMLKEQVSEEMEIMDSMLLDAEIEFEKVDARSRTDTSEKMPTELIADNREIEPKEEIIGAVDNIEIEDEIILDNSEVYTEEVVESDNENALNEFEEEELSLNEQEIIFEDIAEGEKVSLAMQGKNAEVTSQKSSQPLSAQSKKRLYENPEETAFANDKPDESEILKSEAKPSSPIEKANLEKYINEKLDHSKLTDFPGNHTIKFSFAVETSGELSNFNFTQSPGMAFNNEIIRVITEAGNWIPATDKNQSINSTVEFTLEIEVLEQ